MEMPTQANCGLEWATLPLSQNRAWMGHLRNAPLKPKAGLSGLPLGSEAFCKAMNLAIGRSEHPGRNEVSNDGGEGGADGEEEPSILAPEISKP